MTKPMFALVCSGGGAHGAYQVGALKYLHEHFCHDEQSPFQIFAGASCGSLNTSFYAAESWDAKNKRLLLEDLWMGFHVPAYHGNLFKILFRSAWEKILRGNSKSVTWSILDPTPMRQIISQGFRRVDLETALLKKTTRGIAVATTEILSSRTCWFQEGETAKSWNLKDSIGILDKIIGSHLEASCSIPVFLPPVKIGTHYFLDGSASMERPLAAAVQMGATNILTIATDRPVPGHLPIYQQNYSPRFTDAIRMMLTQMSRDRSFDEASQIMAINQLYDRINPSKQDEEEGVFSENSLPDKYRNVNVFMLYPSKRIRAIAAVDKSEILNEGKVKKTRFMFHEKFIRELIQMGYEDTKARHHELQQFFTMKPQSRLWNFIFRSKKS